MKSWNQIKKFSLDHPPQRKFFIRQKKIQQLYDQQKISPYFTKITYDDLFPKDQKFTITNNKYPYRLNNDVEQLLLWINPRKPQLSNYLLSIIHKINKHPDVVIYENTFNNRSVPSIQHFHIYYRIRDFNKLLKLIKDQI